MRIKIDFDVSAKANALKTKLDPKVTAARESTANATRTLARKIDVK